MKPNTLPGSSQNMPSMKRTSSDLSDSLDMSSKIKIRRVHASSDDPITHGSNVEVNSDLSSNQNNLISFCSTLEQEKLSSVSSENILTADHEEALTSIFPFKNNELNDEPEITPLDLLATIDCEDDQGNLVLYTLDFDAITKDEMETEKQQDLLKSAEYNANTAGNLTFSADNAHSIAEVQASTSLFPSGNTDILSTFNLKSATSKWKAGCEIKKRGNLDMNTAQQFSIKIPKEKLYFNCLEGIKEKDANYLVLSRKKYFYCALYKTKDQKKTPFDRGKLEYSEHVLKINGELHDSPFLILRNGRNFNLKFNDKTLLPAGEYEIKISFSQSIKQLDKRSDSFGTMQLNSKFKVFHCEKNGLSFLCIPEKEAHLNDETNKNVIVLSDDEEETEVNNKVNVII